MTLQRMKWVLLGVPGIILMTWMSLALQTRKVDDNALKNAAKSGEWLTYGQSWTEQRHSTLTQITPANIKSLGLAWQYEIGEGGGKQEATPLFANGIIYGQTNWSITFAVDARTGEELWRYDPKADRTMSGTPGQSRLCCGVLSRGIALYEGKVLVPVVDGRIEAVDASNGKLLWSSWAIPKPVPGEISPYSITMAPRVAKGKVFIGNAGGEFPPFRGYVAAFDVDNGTELWRFYTVPGDPSKGFENKAMEAAAKTWAGEWWKMGGGGSIWDGMAYDPDENLLYVGTGNGLPWPQDIRQGKNTPHLDNLGAHRIGRDTGQVEDLESQRRGGRPQERDLVGRERCFLQQEGGDAVVANDGKVTRGVESAPGAGVLRERHESQSVEHPAGNRENAVVREVVEIVGEGFCRVQRILGERVGAGGCGRPGVDE